MQRRADQHRRVAQPGQGRQIGAARHAAAGDPFDPGPSGRGGRDAGHPSARADGCQVEPQDVLGPPPRPPGRPGSLGRARRPPGRSAGTIGTPPRRSRLKTTRSAPAAATIPPGPRAPGRFPARRRPGPPRDRAARRPPSRPRSRRRPRRSSPGVRSRGRWRKPARPGRRSRRGRRRKSRSPRTGRATLGPGRPGPTSRRTHSGAAGSAPIPAIAWTACPPLRSRTGMMRMVERRSRRVLIDEAVSGGGMGPGEPAASWLREGAAIRRALVAEFAALPGVQVVEPVDARCLDDRRLPCRT